MNAVFLPVFAQHLWSAAVVAGLVVVGFTTSEYMVRRHARAKHASIRVKNRSPRRSR